MWLKNIAINKTNCSLIFLHYLDRGICNILSEICQNISTKYLKYFVNIGGENMANRKCDCTKKSNTKTTSRTSNKVEASTDNSRSRTTAKKSSRIKNCN